MKAEKGRFRGNPGEAEREARAKVLRMLPKNGSLISWSQLEGKARSMGMSLRTLRKNLDKLEGSGLVARVVNGKARPPRVYYRSLEGEILSEVYAKVPRDFWDIEKWMHVLAKITNPELRRNILKPFLKLQISFLALELIAMWDRGAIKESVGETQSFFKVMMEQLINPQANNTGFLCRAYSEESGEALNSLFENYIKQAHESMSKLTLALGKVKSYEGE